MGQKTNPIGFRLGVSHKWMFSWYFPSEMQQSQDSARKNLIALSKGIVTSRGGYFLSSIENFIRNLFRRHFYTRISKSRRFLPMHLQYRKGRNNHRFFFLFYVKMKGRR